MGVMGCHLRPVLTWKTSLGSVDMAEVCGERISELFHDGRQRLHGVSMERICFTNTSRRFRAKVVVIVAALGLSWLAMSCGGHNKVAKLQDAASDYNMALRFGRTDVATELVAASELDAFAMRHAAWGGDIRIMDVEYGGIHLVEENKAVVLVTIGWQRPTEPILRVTQLAQEWAYGYGGWKLTNESRTAGDVGLIGEPTDYLRPQLTPDAHFPSVTIR